MIFRGWIRSSDENRSIVNSKSYRRISIIHVSTKRKFPHRRELLLTREILFQSIDKSQYMRDCRERKRGREREIEKKKKRERKREREREEIIIKQR